MGVSALQVQTESIEPLDFGTWVQTYILFFRNKDGTLIKDLKKIEGML